MVDNDTTELAWRVLGNRFVQIGLLIAGLVFAVPPAIHAGTSSADWLCKAMLSHARAPAWEAGVVYLTSTLALAAMAIAAIVLIPFYVLRHIGKQSEHSDDTRPGYERQ